MPEVNIYHNKSVFNVDDSERMFVWVTKYVFMCFIQPFPFIP